MTPENPADITTLQNTSTQPATASTHLDTDRAWHQRICATLLHEWNTCHSADGLLWLAQLVGVAPGIIKTARAAVMAEFGSAFCADHGGDRVRQLISVDVVSLAMATHNNNAAPSQERARFAPRQARRIRSANDRIRKTEIES